MIRERSGDGDGPPHGHEQAREKKSEERNERCKRRTGENEYVRRKEEHP